MQPTQGYERRVNLKDLLFHILYRWRSVLAAALIGALVLGGYAYLNNRKAAAPVETEEKSASTTLQGNYQASNAMYQKLLDENIEYRERSIVMKVDPYQVWRSTAVYAVVMDPSAAAAGTAFDPAVSIAATYPSLIYHDLDEGKLKSIYGEANLHYISEIVSCSSVSDTGTFRIHTYGTTKEMAEEGRQFFEDVILNASKGDIQQMGGHRLVRLSTYTRQIVSSDIESKQASVAKSIVTYQNAITNNNTSISKAPTAADTGKVKKKNLKLYIPAGFVLGLLAMACLYAVLYLFSGRLRSGDELKERFGLSVFGEFNHSRARRSGKGLDGFFERREFRRGGTEDAVVVNNLCALLRERGDGGTILLAGTIPDGRVSELGARLKETLGDGVRLETAGNFLRNSAAIAEAGKASAVILAEEKYVSETDGIRRALEVLAISKTPVIGAIVL